MNSLYSLPAAAALLLGVSLGSTGAVAQSAADVVDITVVPGWQTEDGTHMAGLRVTLQPGWKTYWRVPGDAGIPPDFRFDGSRNIASAALMWPRPDVFMTYGIETIGYATEVVLPIELSPRDAGAPMTLSAQASIGVCKDICLPVELHVSGVIEPGAGLEDLSIKAALGLVPGRLHGAQARCAVDPIADGMRLTATLDVPSQGAQERVFVEPDNPAIWVSLADVSRTGGQVRAEMDLVPPQAKPFALDRSALRFTIVGDSGAVEVMGCTAG